MHVVAGQEAAIPADRMLDGSADMPDRLPAEMAGGLVAVQGEEMRLFHCVVAAVLPACTFAPVADQMLDQIGDRRGFSCIAGTKIPGLDLGGQLFRRSAFGDQQQAARGVEHFAARAAPPSGCG